MTLISNSLLIYNHLFFIKNKFKLKILVIVEKFLYNFKKNYLKTMYTTQESRDQNYFKTISFQ